MKIYNEKTKKIEEFKTKDNQVKMYVCGPTVYDHIHIGNARPLIFFDFVSRLLKKNGYNVMYVSNITDIDDKIINKAIKEHTTEEKIIERYKKEYFSILEKMNIKFDVQPCVTDYIDEIINFINKLINNGYAYEIEGSVYLEVHKIKKYGELSNLKFDCCFGKNDNFNKKDERDFALWKKTDVGLNWDSPWSKGRPGWHTECVVFINEILGKKITIHGGGIDLQFPHHENENAQSLALGNDLSDYWMHNGFVNINNEKMSKSIGNIINTKDFIEQHGVNVLKLLMYQVNYRQPIDINEKTIKDIKKLEQKIIMYYQKNGLTKTNFENSKALEIANNDFDSANLITYLYEILKDNTEKNKIEFSNIMELLNIQFNQKEEQIPEEIKNLINKRNEYKKNKQYEMADKIRKEIEEKGYLIKDTREGTICQKI